MDALLFSLKKNAVYAAVILSVLLILITSALAWNNQRVMKENQVISETTKETIRRTRDLYTDISTLDLGVRGYALGKTEGLLGPFTAISSSYGDRLKDMRALMIRSNYTTEGFEKYAKAMLDYIEFSKQMVALAKVDSMKQFKAMMVEDRGGVVWRLLDDFATKFAAHEEERKLNSEMLYQRAVFSNTILQIVLLVLGIPSLVGVFFRLRKQDKHRQSLLVDLEQNNRRFVFDPGTPMVTDASIILRSSIENIQHASDFIGKISNGDFHADWPGLNSETSGLNKGNLSTALVEMRDKMKKMQDDDKKQLWVTEGLAQFTEIIRKYQNNVEMLTSHATNYLVKYLSAQQGGAFVLQDDADGNEYLELMACYAFDRKKFVNKRIEIGQGLVGQTYLEGTPVYLREVPHGYTTITSGLGDATPKCIMIIPMKYNEKIEGVLELAGFYEWEGYRREFISKASEYMAAAISSVRTSEKMITIVDQMKTQTQQLHEQEEEMRQNLEELAATNEEMKRKEADYIQRLKFAGLDIAS